MPKVYGMIDILLPEEFKRGRLSDARGDVKAPERFQRLVP